MNIFAVSVLGITAAILSVIVGQYKPEFKIYLSLAAGAIIFAAALSVLPPALKELSALADRSGINSLYASILIKCLAVCYIIGLAADTCRDAGESAVAGKLDFAGKIAITILSLPLWRDLIELVISLTEI